jgi:hypothetical protein
MLANLEDEGDDGNKERKEERATIEGTIRITDDVVAKKDHEIAELKAQLVKVDDDSADEEAVRQLVDADEVIRQHRERIAKLEQETEEKLRAAELELSVERAKIAREQVQLAELRAEINSMRPAQHTPGRTVSPAPKRRWLAKLGLTGDEESGN